MAKDWDERARASAMHFIATRYPFDFADLTTFYREGAEDATEFIEPILKSFGLNPSTSRLLEIGCGIGRLFPGYAELGFRDITGIDVSNEMIRLGQEFCPTRNALFLQCNGLDLSSFEDDSFDYVFSYNVFQHIPDVQILRQYVSEVVRVLRPSGVLQLQFMRDSSLRMTLLKVFPGPVRPKIALLYHNLAERFDDTSSAPSETHRVPGDFSTWMINTISPEAIARMLRSHDINNLRIMPDGSQRKGSSFWAVGRKS